MELLNGKKLAQKILLQLKKQIRQKKIVPQLLIVLCGENPESILYTQLKAKKGQSIGIKVDIKKLPETVLEKEIIGIIRESKADGIIVQLPLPKQLNTRNILDSIPQEKDVDGLTQKSKFTPATPKGIMRLLKEYNIDLKSKEIVIINDSDIVGRPLAMLMLNKGATVKICHKFTKNLEKHTKKADIVVSGVGIPNFIKTNMIKDDVTIIDVGISKLGNKVLGDVDFDKIKEKISYITPVPGGVGPMTVAMLLENTIQANILRYKR